MITLVLLNYYTVLTFFLPFGSDEFITRHSDTVICKAFSSSLMRSISACSHLSFFEILPNFVHFCPNFQIFCPF